MEGDEDHLYDDIIAPEGNTHNPSRNYWINAHPSTYLFEKNNISLLAQQRAIPHVKVKDAAQQATQIDPPTISNNQISIPLHLSIPGLLKDTNGKSVSLGEPSCHIPRIVIDLCDDDVRGRNVIELLQSYCAIPRHCSGGLIDTFVAKSSGNADMLCVSFNNIELPMQTLASQPTSAVLAPPLLPRTSLDLVLPASSIHSSMLVGKITPVVLRTLLCGDKSSKLAAISHIHNEIGWSMHLSITNMFLPRVLLSFTKEEASNVDIPDQDIKSELVMFASENHTGSMPLHLVQAVAQAYAKELRGIIDQHPSIVFIQACDWAQLPFWVYLKHATAHHHRLTVAPVISLRDWREVKHGETIIQPNLRMSGDVGGHLHATNVSEQQHLESNVYSPLQAYFSPHTPSLASLPLFHEQNDQQPPAGAGPTLLAQWLSEPLSALILPIESCFLFNSFKVPVMSPSLQWLFHYMSGQMNVLTVLSSGFASNEDVVLQSNQQGDGGTIVSSEQTSIVPITYHAEYILELATHP